MATRKTKQTSAPKPVEAIVHWDKRANLPTADTQEFVASEMEKPIPLRYPRDPSLDPQLVWKGKDELDGDDLVADAPPIYIQEKINPKVLIENLRQTAAKGELEPELILFEAFDGLGELDQIEFYQHEANWSNRMILGDSLNVMASLAEREALRGKVQMIYIDPPYGIKFGSNWQASARKREVKDGKLEDASREVEQIKAFRDTWELGIHSYLTYLRDRLTVAKDLLTESGSIFVQIGDENVHLVRALMDEVFGREQFICQIAFRVKSSLGSDFLGRQVDFILWYASDRSMAKFHQLYIGQSVETSPEFNMVEFADGTKETVASARRRSRDLSGARYFTAQNLASSGYTESCTYTYTIAGRSFPPPRGRSWKTHLEGMRALERAGRLVPLAGSLRFAYYFDDFPYSVLTDVWMDTFGEQNKSYVVQTNQRVVERCMLMTTDPGDLVLDPTCGSGTTAYVAENWGRRWITIDTSRVALALSRQRIMGAQFPYYTLVDSHEGRAKESELSAAPLPLGDPSDDIRYGFVYDRAKHITLRSIANNPDIIEGMSSAEIETVIRRHADFEFLYDKPFEDKRKVRVSGPFTVESLSPHRSLAFAGSAVDGTGAVNEDLAESASNGDAAFEQTILSNLRTAGIQNGRRNERLTFDTVEPYASSFIQAVGERPEAADGSPRRVGISIGPQYGTVGAGFIKDAAREAIETEDLDLLVVLAFAFDPAVLGQTDDYTASDVGFANVAAERKLGRVPVLLVRMNADLVMGEELKKTGAGNLFTVFGEPDIAIEEDGDKLRVILHGVDVYDPNTGEIRPSDPDQIALWMIDTVYNEESFFVRHCYFPGGQDPFKGLKKALKAEVDEDAWASLCRAESRPFPRPETGKIAVKVINDYGDEVVKVFGGL